jgi:predicted MFS family arabinose efflux permease
MTTPAGGGTGPETACTMGRMPATPAALVRGRVAVSLLFLLYGAILGTWTARIPAVKQRLALSDGQLSVGLLAFAAGAILGMQLSGRLVDRYRSGRVMIPAALADGVLLVLPALAFDLASLVVCLLAFGAVHGTLNVAMNVNAVEVQRAWRGPILSSCHAVYSGGGFLGAAAGGLFAAAGAGAGATFLSVGAGAVVVALAAGRWALPPEPAAQTDPASPPEPSRARRPGTRIAPGVIFLGVLVFCCLVGEGAAADWSSVYLRDSLGSTAGFAAAAYGAFSIMMMAGRLVGDQLTARLGPVRLVQASGVLAAAGLAAALLAGRPIAGVVGFGCLGAGLSCIAPQVFSAAGSRDPARAGSAIARVAGIGFLGFVVGPVVIGAAAQLFGLPRALAIPAVLALFVAAAAPALRPAAPA